jgi:hypothetical protein
MNLKAVLVVATLAAAAGGSAIAADVSIPADSVGSIGVFAAYEKFKIYSEVCADAHPEARARFESVMTAFSARMSKLGAEVLATPEFLAMRNQPVPASLVDAFRQDFQNTRRMHQANPGSYEGCKGAHDNFESAGDDHWKAGMATALTELRETGRPFALALAREP